MHSLIMKKSPVDATPDAPLKFNMHVLRATWGSFCVTAMTDRGRDVGSWSDGGRPDGAPAGGRLARGLAASGRQRPVDSSLAQTTRKYAVAGHPQAG